MSAKTRESASMLIPPPTVSAILPSRDSSIRREGPTSDDELLSIRRVQSSLERHLQELLDAQSDGLIRQTELADVSASSTNELPPRLPSRVTLRAARHGMVDTIQHLTQLKIRELEKVESHLRDTQAIVGHAIEWRDRRQGLERSIYSIKHAEYSAQVQSLVEEDNSLQEQIDAMQEKLSQLRTRQAEIKSRLSEEGNSKSAELSSYQSSLEMLQGEIQSFLRRPLPPTLVHVGDLSVLQRIPPKRRTLDMLIEHAEGAHYSLTERQSYLERECDALAEGGGVWEEAVEAIEIFERHLRQATKGTLTPDSVTYPSRQSPVEQVPSQILRPLEALLNEMRRTMDLLQNLLDQAESRQWTLLIAAIGAEVEAFNKGQEILQGLVLKSHGSTKRSPRGQMQDAEIEDPGSLFLSQTHD